jgi:hypothetical protein
LRKQLQQLLQAEVLQATLLQAEVLQAEVLQSQVLQATLLQASLLRRCPGLRWLRLRLVFSPQQASACRIFHCGGQMCLSIK